MPHAHKGETESAFLDRCMAYPDAVSKFPDASQRAAFCHSRYREDKAKMSEGDPVSGTVKDVEIFKVGTWHGSRTVEATPAMLDDLARNFKEVNSINGYGVPVKLGHSKGVGDPAYGWVTDVRRQGDTLVADFGDVPSEIVDAIGKRRYNSTSIELLPKMTYQGKTFNHVLSGVALLGAEWPAVKGLKPLSAAQFAEDAEKLELSTMAQNDLKFTQAEHDTLVLGEVSRVRTEMQAAINELAGKLTVTETRATVAEAALKIAQKDAQSATFGAIIDAAIAKGVLLPKQRETTLAFAQNFPAEVKVGDKTVKAVDAFKDWIDGLPAKVSFGERGRAPKQPAPGASDQKAADAVNEAVQAYMSEHKEKDYEKAMQAVFAADPDLKARYATEM